MPVATSTTPAPLHVETAAYLRLPAAPERILPRLAVNLADQAYEPRLDDLESDWVAHIAAPAFRLYRQRKGGAQIPAFCSIGTGSGLDALAGVELLGAARVGVTDVHEEVVRLAHENIARNARPEFPLVVESGHGDLLAPLRPFLERKNGAESTPARGYDVIYENLPNVPLADPAEVAARRNSSSYVPPRSETIPPLVRQQMLDLHYLALAQARDFLAPGGAVLSCLGARVPLAVFLELARLAGLRGSFLTYGWKAQAMPGEVIPGHAQSQRDGFGPFHFYRANALREAFAGITPEESGPRALELEASLAAEKLDAVAADEAFRRGEKIGHTVAVLESVLA